MCFVCHLFLGCFFRLESRFGGIIKSVFFVNNVSSTKIKKRLRFVLKTLIKTGIKTLIWTKIDESLSRKAN
jgi:hypothetical protein